jgi:hypothetical protein
MAKRPVAEDKISTSFKIPRALHIKLKIAAAKESREMGELVEDALTAYLHDTSSISAR